MLMPSLRGKCFCCFCFGKKKKRTNKTKRVFSFQVQTDHPGDLSRRGGRGRRGDFSNSVESIHRTVVSQRFVLFVVVFGLF